jgi:hypothetical protein
MREHSATRTLVKSPPELWLTCSEESLLGRHLEPFGEIRITRLEPESTVAWEGEATSGTVRIEPSGWGTKVTLTAVADEDAAPEDPAPEVPAADDRAAEDRAQVDPPPEVPVVGEEVEQEPEVRAAPETVALEQDPQTAGFRELLWRLLRRSRRDITQAGAPYETSTASEPRFDAPNLAQETSDLAQAPPDPGQAQNPLPNTSLALDLDAALTAALDSLGRAHHRPFSRS